MNKSEKETEKTEKIKVLYFGSPGLAVPSLASLHAHDDFDVIGVVCPPPKPFGRKKQLKSSPVELFAKEEGIEVYYATKKADLLPIYTQTKPDVAMVVAFGVIFPSEVLDLPKYKTLNLHFSLLPAYRGASPVQTAILNNEKTSGIALQVMRYKLDTGDIIYKKEYEIEKKTTGELFDFFAEESADVLPEVIKNYTENPEKVIKQDENEATYCHKFTKQDGEVDLENDTSLEIYNKWRAFTPWPGIYIKTAKGNLKLLEVANDKPENEEDWLKVPTKDGVIWAGRLQLSGKQAQTARVFALGQQELVRSISGEY